MLEKLSREVVVHPTLIRRVLPYLNRLGKLPTEYNIFLVFLLKCTSNPVEHHKFSGPA